MEGQQKGAGGGNGGANGGPEKEFTWAKLLTEVRQALVPVLISAGGLLGFVAFAGAMVLWTRFDAVGIPPEQAIDVAPQGELVAIGSVFLLLFGFFGALATMTVFLVDRGGRPVPGMARTLLFLLMIEGVVAIVLVESRSALQTIGDVELYLLPLALCAWATTLDRFGELKDDLCERGLETGEPQRPTGILRPFGGRRHCKDQKVPEKLRIPLIVMYGPFGLVGLATIAAVVLLLSDASAWLFVWLLSGFGIAFLAWVLVLWILNLGTLGDGDMTTAECAAAKPEDAAPAEAAGCDEDKRRRRPRPLRLDLNGNGMALIAAAMVTSVLLLWWRLGADEWWIVVVLGVGGLLAIALWRIATLAMISNQRKVWFALGAFLSVPLLGTIGAMVQNLDHPKVQPMALIRKTDGPKESVQGLYVTETGDRIYFANVATEGCGNKVTPHSGRLLWVPRDEVVAMSVGPLQGVEEAGKAALEMSYALTPAVETSGTSIDLGVGEEEAAQAGARDTRLQNAGPAVRPNFGTGMRLEPETADPGETVTLRMSKPNFTHEVEGFGSSRAGHNLRVGGEVADIAKEAAGSAEGAEYVELENGRLVILDKEGPWVKKPDGEFILDEDDADDEGEGPYVRVDDPAVPGLAGQPASEAPIYVRVVEVGNQAARVAGAAPRLRLAGGAFQGRTWGREAATLSHRPLLRQAWDPDHVRFHVPMDAHTSVVTVECNQLAGAPLLQVSHAPSARMAVEVQPRSARVRFDGSRSSEEGETEALSWRWKIDGVTESHRNTVGLPIPLRKTPYSIELTVTDKAGNSDTTKLQLLRLPTPSFGVGLAKPKVRRAIRADREAIESAVALKRPKAVELDGYIEARRRAARGRRLALVEDTKVRQALLRESKANAAEHAVRIEELTHAGSCPLTRHALKGPQARHVDLFLLDEGVSVKHAKGCHPDGQKSALWHPPPAAEPLASSSSTSSAAR